MTLSALAQPPASEVLVTFGPAFSVRFGGIDEHAATLDTVFGSPDWRYVLTRDSSSKKELLITEYKNAMWAVDPHTGARFRDPKDPRQGVLDFGDEAHLAPLERMLPDEIVRRRQASVDDLCDFTLFDTAFRPTHTRRAIRGLLTTHRLDRRPQSGS